MTAVFLISVVVIACAVAHKKRRRKAGPLSGAVLMRQEVTRELLRNLADVAGVTWTPEMSERALAHAIKQSISDTESRCERAEDALWKLVGVSMGVAPPRPPVLDADAAVRQIVSSWPKGPQQ